MEQKKKKTFHRHLKTKGMPIYLILFIYLILGWFYPVIGLIAIVCMIGPVLTSIWRGRYWCGNICPRGNMYDRLVALYSPHRPIPKFVRTFGFRLFMVLFIFTMFGIQLSYAKSWSDVGRVFWTIILITTIVGIVLSFIYAPRTWCSFCPMGTISRWVAPKKEPLPKGFKSVHVGNACLMNTRSNGNHQASVNGGVATGEVKAKCMSCARVCPMQLTPYDARGEDAGYLHPDCIKCGKCTLVCPKKIISLSE